MEYRKLPRGTENVSVLGMGMGSAHNAGGQAQVARLVESAMEAKINFFDLCPAEYRSMAGYADAFRGCRSSIYTQMHLGAVYEGVDGKYGWTTDSERARAQFEHNMDVLGFDYVDFGFIHCIDEVDDFDKVMANGSWDYLLDLKRQGVVHHLGASTHSLEVARLFLRTGLVDLMMFSLNPAYDYTDMSQYGKGTIDDRAAFYRECEVAGVGLSVMKAFAGGQLLDGAQSPFGIDLSQAQLIRYALDRPAVLTVLPGVRDIADLQCVVAAVDASDDACDYSILGGKVPASKSSCVYCNHCQPCPQGIDVGLVNKYYDLARIGDSLADSHYRNLSVRADSCLACGHCEKRCPFGVKQEQRMKDIADFFA